MVCTYNIDSERWVKMEVLHSVFLHPSISRIEEDKYQAFFRYVSTKEYPAVASRLLKAMAMKTLLLFPSKATRKRHDHRQFIAVSLQLPTTR